jgi:CRISPR/Cas system-associated exonuclease Cas4 (RecB family)
VPFVLELDTFVLVGFADLIYNKNIYEIKVVTEIDPIYYLQLAIYTWLSLKLGYTIESSYLYNILDGFLYKLNYEKDNLNKLVNTLIETKKNGLIEQSNEIFLKNCSENNQKIVNI